MNKRFFFITGAIAAMIWSAVMIYFYASGRIESYVTDSFRLQALIGGIVLAIIALFNLLNISEKVSCGHDHDHDHDHKEGEACDHDHSHSHNEDEEIHSHHHEQETASGMAINYLILLVPVILAAILTPDAFSAAHVKNNMTSAAAGNSTSKLSLASRKPGDDPAPSVQTIPEDQKDIQPAQPATTADPYAFTEADLDNLVSKNEAGEYVITVPEIFYTGGDEALQAVLSGKPVETTGQAMEETTNNEGGKRMRIFRLYMECCAADARPISVPVDFPDGLPEFKEMRWYSIHGTMSFEQLNGYTVPVIKATKLVETEPEDGSQFYDKSQPN
jgi:uncharacterized repeat protein (TIGR03943 family)